MKLVEFKVKNVLTICDEEFEMMKMDYINL